MKTRLITCLAITLMLIATLSLPAVAEVIGTETAYVSVNSDIDVTVSDEGSDGIRFGPLDAGATDKPDVAQGPSTPSVTISVHGTSIVDLQVSGTNFGTGFAVSNAKFNTTNSTTGTTAMSTSLVSIATNISPENDVDVWFWIDVPASGVIAGDYTSTFTFDATEHS